MSTLKLLPDYKEAASRLPEKSILLVKMGDFWEAYDDMAVDMANRTGFTLTHRMDTRMCGCPYHILESVVSDLTVDGYTVALVADRSIKPFNMEIHFPQIYPQQHDTDTTED